MRLGVSAGQRAWTPNALPVRRWQSPSASSRTWPHRRPPNAPPDRTKPWLHWDAEAEARPSPDESPRVPGLHDTWTPEVRHGPARPDPRLAAHSRRIHRQPARQARDHLAPLSDAEPRRLGDPRRTRRARAPVGLPAARGLVGAGDRVVARPRGPGPRPRAGSGRRSPAPASRASRGWRRCRAAPRSPARARASP